MTHNLFMIGLPLVCFPNTFLADQKIILEFHDAMPQISDWQEVL